jgi:hypothetical protein
LQDAGVIFVLVLWNGSWRPELRQDSSRDGLWQQSDGVERDYHAMTAGEYFDLIIAA